MGFMVWGGCALQVFRVVFMRPLGLRVLSQIPGSPFFVFVVHVFSEALEP